MFCGKCGKNVPDDSRFCPFCAHDIKPAQAPEPTPPPAATVPMPPQPPTPAPPQPMYQQPAPQPAPEYAAPAAPPAQSSGSGAMVAILVVVGLLVLLAGGIGAYAVVKKLGPAPPVQTTADAGGSSATEMPVDVDGSSETEAIDVAASECLDDLKQIVLGALMYAQDHNDKLPPADWVAAIDPYIQNASLLRCPSRTDLAVAYAMNRGLFGVALSDIASPSETILFYETDQAGDSPAGGMDYVPEGGIHNGEITVAFADGHCKLLPVDEVTYAMFGEASVSETSGGSGSSGGDGADDFVGTWEFVGEPGPWGEGAPFNLERSGNALVGTAGLPYYEETIRLKLTFSNGQLEGDSTTTYPDGETEVMALRMELDASSDLLTVTYQGGDGGWLTRVAKRV